MRVSRSGFSSPCSGQKGRRMSILDPFDIPLSGNQLIEAAAGTGKTYTLAALFVRMVLEGRPVREILVVTFTEAAAAELKDRFGKRLREALKAFQSGDFRKDEFLESSFGKPPLKNMRTQATSSRQPWRDSTRLRFLPSTAFVFGPSRRTPLKAGFSSIRSFPRIRPRFTGISPPTTGRSPPMALTPSGCGTFRETAFRSIPWPSS